MVNEEKIMLEGKILQITALPQGRWKIGIKIVPKFEKMFDHHDQMMNWLARAAREAKDPMIKIQLYVDLDKMVDFTGGKDGNFGE